MTFIVCLLSNDGTKIRILGTWQLRFIICLLCLFFRNQPKKVGLSKHKLKNFHCVECHFIFTFKIIWICTNLSLFEFYLKFMTLMYFILFYLNL